MNHDFNDMGEKNICQQDTYIILMRYVSRFESCKQEIAAIKGKFLNEKFIPKFENIFLF